MFKVGDKVTSPKFSGSGEVVNILHGPYPVIVENVDCCTYTFTLDGRYFADSSISLFHVKEESVMEKVTVTIQVTKSFEITKAERNLVLDLMNDKFKAIKFIRAQHDLPLIEAKRICEAVWSTP